MVLGAGGVVLGVVWLLVVFRRLFFVARCFVACLRPCRCLFCDYVVWFCWGCAARPRLPGFAGQPGAGRVVGGWVLAVGLGFWVVGWWPVVVGWWVMVVGAGGKVGAPMLR